MGNCHDKKIVNLKVLSYHTCGLYYKPMTNVNDDSRVVNKLEASLIEDARVVIYDCHMFIVQATGWNCFQNFGFKCISFMLGSFKFSLSSKTHCCTRESLLNGKA